MRRFLLTTVAALSIIGFSEAANLPALTGPVEPSQLLYTFNTLIQSINNGVSGQLAAIPGVTVSSGTTKAPFYSTTIPGGRFSTVGQVFHAIAIGVNSADANAKTVTFDFGAIACAIIVTGSGNTWEADFWVQMTGAATQTYSCQGQTGTSVVASVQGTGTVSLASSIAADVSYTAATGGTMTANQSWMDQIK